MITRWIRGTHKLGPKFVSWDILRILWPCVRNLAQDLPEMRKHYVRNLFGRASEDVHEVKLSLKLVDCWLQTKLEISAFVDAAFDSL